MNSSARLPRLALVALLLGLLGLAPAGFAAAHLDQVVVVFKTHFDIGYTDLASNVVQRYRTTMIDQALAVVDQNRDLPPAQQFVWTIPGWPMARILDDWPGQTPDRQRRIMEAFKQGRFAVHALPFSTHTESLEPEDLVRGLGYASRLTRAAGLPLPRGAKMTDVPCHSWIVPTLLRHAGVDFLHLGCNAASSSPRVPLLFWWEGPDGSRLLTMYSATGYGTGLVPPADWPHRTWLALIQTGDNHGPPTPEEVKQLLAEAKVKLPGITVRIGQLSDFADALLAEKPELPVVRGDMPDTWIYGPMCDPAGARLARNIRPEIAIAEALNTELRTWQVAVQDAAGTIATAYEQSLLYGEHTWGGALYWVSQYNGGRSLEYGEDWRQAHAAGKFNRLEASWAEHTAYIEKARDLTLPLLQNELQSLADSVAAENCHDRIVVYNPLPWKRSGVVAMDVSGTPLARRPSPAWVVQGPAKSTRLNYENDGQTLRLSVEDVPANGYRTYRLARAGMDRRAGAPSNATLENRFLRIALDPQRGTIKSVVDKRTGRELVDAGAEVGFGQFLYERFSANEVQRFVKAYVKIDASWATNELGKPNLPPASEVPYRAASPEHFQLLPASASSGTQVAVMDAPVGNGVPFAVTTKVRLDPNEPWFEIELTLHDKPADSWPEAGWICLPFKIASPQFRLGRPGSIIDPAKDIVPGANRHLLELNTGLTIADPQGRGAGLCALDNPLVSLGEPGCWKYSLDFVPRKPAVYVNLFNNQWTTNFRLWNAGTWTARVRVWAVEAAADTEASLVTPSLEARYPLLAAMAQGHGGTQPRTQTGLELSRKGVLVTAFGANPDGAGTVLRLWELAGRSGTCRVQLPKGLRATSVQPVDLRGRPAGQAIPARGGALVCSLHAFAPASFILLP
jgi:hypothetical protein